MSMSGIVDDQYAAYKRQYDHLMGERPVQALEAGQEAAKFGVKLAVAQTAFGIGAK